MEFVSSQSMGGDVQVRASAADVVGRVNVFSMKQVLAQIDTHLRSPDSGFNQIIMLNPEIVEITLRNEALFNAIQSAGMITADGMGVVFALNLITYYRRPSRVTGVDLVQEIFSRYRKDKSLTFFLLGAKDSIRLKVVDRLVQLGIARDRIGECGGNYRTDIGKMPYKVEEFRPTILLPAATAFTGELLLYKNRQFLADCGVKIGFNAGQTFDVLAGSVARAPDIVQRSALEWAWRLAQDPIMRIPRQTRLLLFAMRVLAASAQIRMRDE